MSPKDIRVLLGFYLKYLGHDRLQRSDYLGALSVSQLVERYLLRVHPSSRKVSYPLAAVFAACKSDGFRDTCSRILGE
jgi:hypothetical protein